MNERIENYIHSIIPKNIPQKRKQLIHDEMESHILEQAEFYMEIGYDEKVSIDKALECMGEDDEIKRSIINKFEELYQERTFFAVITGFVVLLLNLLAILSGAWVVLIVLHEEPNSFKNILSAAIVFIILFVCLPAYKKGFRKTLAGIGIANLLIAVTFLSVYPQCILYSTIITVEYLLDRFTPIMLPPELALDIQYYGTYYGSWGLILFVALLCFALSIKIKRCGIPKKGKKGIIALTIIFIIATLTATVLYPNAKSYYENYASWFYEVSDTSDSESMRVYSLINDATANDEAEKLLHENGYISTEEFLSSVNTVTAKQFKYNLDKLNFLFGDEYDIYFKENKNTSFIYGQYTADLFEISTNDRYIITEWTDGNHFIFLKKGIDGKIKAKGVGNGFEDYRKFGCDVYFCCDKDDLTKCAADFETMKIGDSEADIMSRFGVEYGDIYTEFTEYNDNTTETFYRIHCSGDNTYHRNPNEIYCLYFEFSFEDGKLTKGDAHMVMIDETIDATVN